METLLRKLDARLEHLGVHFRQGAGGGAMLEDDVTRKEVGWISEAISMLEGAWERGVKSGGASNKGQGSREMVYGAQKQKNQKGTGLEEDCLWCTRTYTHTHIRRCIRTSIFETLCALKCECTRYLMDLCMCAYR